MSDRKVRVVAVRVGQEPTVEEIDDKLKTWQEFVGGYVQFFPIGGGYVAGLNEDGMQLNLPDNGCGLLGNYFFTKQSNNDDRDLESLTDADIESVMKFYRRKRHEQHPRVGMTIKSYTSMEDMFHDIGANHEAREADFRLTQGPVTTGFERHNWDKGRKEKLDQVIRDCGLFLHVHDVESAMERIELYALERHQELLNQSK